MNCPVALTLKEVMIPLMELIIQESLELSIQVENLPW